MTRVPYWKEYHQLTKHSGVYQPFALFEWPEEDFTDKLDRWRHIQNRQGWLGTRPEIYKNFDCMMTWSAQVDKTPVTVNNGPNIQDYTHPDDFILPTWHDSLVIKYLSVKTQINQMKLPCSCGSRSSGKGGVGGGRSTRPWNKGRAVSKNFFRSFGPQFGLKIRGGRPPPPAGPYPESATAVCIKLSRTWS